jgi:hypothetical protein
MLVNVFSLENDVIFLDLTFISHLFFFCAQKWFVCLYYTILRIFCQYFSRFFTVFLLFFLAFFRAIFDHHHTLWCNEFLTTIIAKFLLKLLLENRVLLHNFSIISTSRNKKQENLVFYKTNFRLFLSLNARLRWAPSVEGGFKRIIAIVGADSIRPFLWKPL